MKFFHQFGQYLILIRTSFLRPEQPRMLWRRFMYESDSLGLQSLVIVSVISIFVGAVTTINTAYQLVSGLIAETVIGSVVSESIILELAPTITSLVLAGKIGSNIATEIGSMRVSEQIDAMEVMGVNAPGFLILPKILALLFTLPMLIIMSMAIGVFGGWGIGYLTGVVAPENFIIGAQEVFRPYTFFFALIKVVTFAFIISSVSAYQGYYVTGGSTGVGAAATRSVVYSSILILLSDYVLAQIFLN